MIICRLLLCAQGVVRDAEHGSISVYNIMESLQAAGFPFFIQQMAVFALLEREPGDPPQHEIRFRLSMGEAELVTVPLAIDFRASLRNRSTLNIQGLVIPHPGSLLVSASLGETVLATYGVIVEQLSPPRVEARQTSVGPPGADQADATPGQV